MWRLCGLTIGIGEDAGDVTVIPEFKAEIDTVSKSCFATLERVVAGYGFCAPVGIFGAWVKFADTRILSAVTCSNTRAVCVSGNITDVLYGTDGGELNVLNIYGKRLGVLVDCDAESSKIWDKIAPYCDGALCIARKVSGIDCDLAGYLADTRNVPLIIAGSDGVFASYKTKSVK